MEPVSLEQSQQNQALNLFNRSITLGFFFRLWSKLTHKSFYLQDLNENLKRGRIQNSCYSGIRPVSIRCIKGTLGKTEEFDNDFHPIDETSRSRWLAVACEKLRGNDLPAVDLIDINGIYFVRDGHHRISVARSMGQKYIEAEITTMRIKSQIG